MDVAAAEKLLRPENIHFPHTTLICMENTHNRGGGIVMPLKKMDAVYRFAREHQLAVHLDGARLFHAVVATGRPMTDFTRYTDSVMFCLSKGLCAPVGSLVAGSKEFIARARRARKLVGGGMRQAGVLAAAGIVALEQMIGRLSEDHANASYLAKKIAGLPGVGIDLTRVETNMVAFDLVQEGVTANNFLTTLRQKGILAGSVTSSRIRMVIHYPLTRQEMDLTAQVVREVLEELAVG